MGVFNVFSWIKQPVERVKQGYKLHISVDISNPQNYEKMIEILKRKCSDERIKSVLPYIKFTKPAVITAVSRSVLNDQNYLISYSRKLLF